MSGTVLVQMYPHWIVAQMEGRCQIGLVRRSCCVLHPSIIATLRDRNGRKTLAYPNPSQHWKSAEKSLKDPLSGSGEIVVYRRQPW